MSRSSGCAVGIFFVSMVLWSGATKADPAGYIVGSVPGAPGGTNAATYAPDGTLYASDMSAATTAVTPPGGGTSTLTVTGPSLVSVSGMCVSPDGSTLYVTDNKGYGDGLGELYAVDVTTGAATTLATGIDLIDNVAVRSTGEVFVSDAAGPDYSDLTGPGLGGVYRIDTINGGIAETVVAGLDYAAGLAFDSAGNLIYQHSTESFLGEVYRLSIADVGGGLTYGTPELLAADLGAAFSMAVDSEDDVFVTGVGGLFELDRDAGGSFLGTASLLEAQTFSTEITFRAGGTNPFEPYAGYDGGRLAYVASYGAANLRTLDTVPEPTMLAVLSMGVVAVIRRR